MINRKILFVIFFFSIIFFFNSCSYQVYYPQRLNIYAFDSAHQTKIITRPYAQIIGAQIGVSRSYTKHFLVALNGQINSSIIRLYKGSNYYSANTFSYAPNISAGYYKTNSLRNGFEILSQISYERNNIYFKYYPNNNFLGPAAYDYKKINYLIPSFQFSYYHMPRYKTNIFGTCRFSYLYADALKDGLNFSDTLLSKKLYSQNLMIEPGIQFMFRKLPAVRFECSTFIGVKNTSLTSYYSPLMISIRINPEYLLRQLKIKK